MFITNYAFSQLIEFPDSMQKQVLIIGTDRFLSTQLTTGNIDLGYNNNFVSGRLWSNFKSTTTLINSVTKDQIDVLWQNNFFHDKQNLLNDNRRNITLLCGLEGTISNEKENKISEVISGINNSHNLFFGVGGEYNPSDSNKINLLLGIASNKQLNNTNSGAGISADINLAGTFEDFYMNLTSKGRVYNVSPKLITLSQINLEAQKAFSENDLLGININYEYYGNNIFVKRNEEDLINYGGLEYEAMQKKVDNRAGVSLNFKFSATQDWQFSALASINSKSFSQQETTEGLPPLPRDIDPFRLIRDELGLAFSINQVIYFDWLRLSNSFSFSDNSQFNTIDTVKSVSEFEYNSKKDIFHNSDFISRNIAILNELECAITNKDSLTALGNFAIYRYDTPYDKNKLDKDEQQINALLRYTRNHSKYLNFRLALQYFYTHLVYLFKEYSNDNHQNNVIRFSQNIDYNLNDDLLNYFNSDITANYTQYDYNQILQGERGRSFRELHLNDSLFVKLKNGLFMRFSNDYRYSLRGIFNPIKFSESPLEVSKSFTTEVSLKTIYHKNWEFEFGNRLFVIYEYRKDARGLLSVSSENLSVGPTVKVNIPLLENSSVTVTGWFENKYFNKIFTNSQPWLNIALKHSI